MIERILLIAILTSVAVGGFYALRLAHMRHMALGLSPALGQSDVPILLYFHSDDCAACPSQTRQIDELRDSWSGRLVIEAIDAQQEQHRTKQYQVLTLPTTIWLDGKGQIRQVNYGLTPAAKLVKQLARLVA